MKEYKVIRELEPAQPMWGPETTRDRLEKNLNELARNGWIVKSFSVNPQSSGSSFVFRPASFAYFVLLEREMPEAASQ
jgi:hypothetical protein